MPIGAGARTLRAIEAAFKDPIPQDPGGRAARERRARDAGRPLRHGHHRHHQLRAARLGGVQLMLHGETAARFQRQRTKRYLEAVVPKR